MASRTKARSAGVPLLAALVLACSETVSTAPEVAHELAASAVTPGTPDHVEPSEGLPFRLDGTAVFVAQDLAPDFGPPVFGKSDFQGRCSTPSDFVIRFGLSARGTHLGAVTGDVEHCTQIDFRSGALTVTDGTVTVTTSAGDVLLATYSGAAGPSGLEEYVTFAGGRGRFAGAAGGGIARPVCDQATGTCTYSLSGALTYEASDAAAR